MEEIEGDLLLLGVEGIGSLGFQFGPFYRYSNECRSSKGCVAVSIRYSISIRSGASS